MRKESEIAIGEEGSPGPLCPACSKELHHLNDHKGTVKTLWELHVLSCPHCRKVLEVRTIPK
jgi:uncharacterized protein YbaR (Trm112 family)